MCNCCYFSKASIFYIEHDRAGHKITKITTQVDSILNTRWVIQYCRFQLIYSFSLIFHLFQCSLSFFTCISSQKGQGAILNTLNQLFSALLFNSRTFSFLKINLTREIHWTHRGWLVDWLKLKVNWCQVEKSNSVSFLSLSSMTPFRANTISHIDLSIHVPCRLKFHNLHLE